MARDLYINPLTNDIELGPDLDLRFVEAEDELAQRLTTLLGTQLGTHVIDDTFGLPYFEQILVKAPRLEVVSSILRGVLASHPLVTEIRRFDVTYDEVARTLTVVSELATTEGLVSLNAAL